MKTIALIAHDNKKPDMVAYVQEHRSILECFALIGTGTTGALIQAETGLHVDAKHSGPVGGDIEIANEVIQGNVAAVIFFVDELTAHPHDPDIQTLLRLCNIYDVPLATNPATARLLIKGDL